MRLTYGLNLLLHVDIVGVITFLQRCGRKPGPQTPDHPRRMPVATDLAELLS